MGSCGELAGRCLLPRRLIGHEVGVDCPVEVLDGDLSEHGNQVVRVERDALHGSVHRELAILACRKRGVKPQGKRGEAKGVRNRRVLGGDSVHGLERDY